MNVTTPPPHRHALPPYPGLSAASSHELCDPFGGGEEPRDSGVGAVRGGTLQVETRDWSSTLYTTHSTQSGAHEYLMRGKNKIMCWIHSNQGHLDPNAKTSTRLCRLLPVRKSSKHFLGEKATYSTMQTPRAITIIIEISLN